MTLAPKQAVPAAERETLFADVVKEKDRAEREARKAERKRRMAAFRALLEATPAIKARLPSRAPCNTLWSSLGGVDACLHLAG
jgi:hypothetical protein